MICFYDIFETYLAYSVICLFPIPNAIRSFHPKSCDFYAPEIIGRFVFHEAVFICGILWSSALGHSRLEPLCVSEHHVAKHGAVFRHLPDFVEVEILVH